MAAAAESGIAALTNVNPPPVLKLKEQPLEEWAMLKRLYQNYAVITKLKHQDKPYRLAVLLNAMGPVGVRLYDDLVFTEEEDVEDTEVIIAKLDTVIRGEINETYERYVFNKRNQSMDETFDEYLSALKLLAKSCNFCDCLHDSLIRDRILMGIRDQNSRKKLLQKRKLTLRMTIDICRSDEATSNHMRSMGGSTAEIHKVNYQRETRKPPTRTRKPFARTTPSDNDMLKSCKFCGRTHEHRKESCYAWGKTCHKCGKQNHFSNCCQLGRKKVHHVTATSDSVDESIMGVHGAMSRKGPIYAELLLNNELVKLQVDCGATVNVLPEMHVNKDDIQASNVTLHMWNKTTRAVVGKTQANVVNPKTNKAYEVWFEVVQGDFTPLIGRQTAEQMELITVNYDSFKLMHGVTTSNVLDEYQDVFDGGLGTLPGKVHLHVEPGAVAVQCPARRVPITLKTRLKTELDRLVRTGVICPVTEPTEWCNQISVQTKKDMSLRICIDPRPLNKVLHRELYPLPTMDEVLPELSTARVLSKLDLQSGYWHCELDDESSLLTTIITPFGRYKWNRLPFGTNVSAEIFQRKLNQTLEGLDGVICVADDIVVFGRNDEDHDEKLRLLLQRCRDTGVKLNRKKCQIRTNEITFMGHRVTSEGLKPDDKKIEAIVKMTNPTDVKGVQRLQGTVGYLAKFLPGLSDAMEPIRRLTHPDVPWQWTDEQERAMTKIKDLTTKSPILAYYDPKAELVIECDASETGLGAALLQKGRPIAYASRSLTDTETRYAQLEKECLAIVFSLERFHQYTFGRRTIVHSDHKPLEMIVRKPLYKAPRRLQGMLLRMLQYDTEVIYHKGKEMYIADTLSRAYLKHEGGTDNFGAVNAVKHLPISTERMAMLKNHTERDETLQTLKQVILRGWPDTRDEVPTSVHPYFSMRDELAVHDALIFKGERVVIPEGMRKLTKECLHSSHLGVESVLRRARECLYWPNMASDIRQVVENCEACRTYQRAQQKETLMPHETPTRQWEKVGVDLFSWEGRDYQVVVDYTSNFWEVDRMTSTTTASVIKVLKGHFARQGIPTTVVSDNGPQYTSEEFQVFTAKWDIEHQTSAPGHQNANGRAEAAVKAAKLMFTKCKASKSDPYLALLELRNTPTQGVGSSPAQRLLNRRTRTLLPTTARLLAPRGEEYLKKDRTRIDEQKAKQTENYNRTARDLPVLEEGDVVRMKPFRLGQKAWEKAVVQRRLDERSYEVDTPDGTYRRNRVHLRRTREEATPQARPLVPETKVLIPVVADPQTPPSETSNLPATPPRRSTRLKTRPARLDDYVNK